MTISIQIHCKRLLPILLITCTCAITSCFGPKNLVSTQNGTPHYDYVGDTLNDWSLVRQDGFWGYASADGHRKIEPTFFWATDFTDGMALVQDKHGYRYINAQGKLLRRIKAPHGYAFAEGLAPLAIKGKWGYINRKGKKIIKPQFDWAEPFHENRATVSIGMKKGYINPVGQVAIPAIYEEAHTFRNGVAIVRKNMQFGLIDTLGNFLLPNKYDEIKLWENDFYRLGVYNPGTDRVNTFGLADAHANLLLDTLYSYIDLQEDRYIRAKKDSLYGLFDRSGKVIVPMAYTYLGDIWDTTFMAAEKGGDWGFLDTRGKVLLPFEYKPRIGASDDRIWVRKDSMYILMDYRFREIKRFSDYDKVFTFSNGFAAVRIRDPNDYYGVRYGFIDKEGNEVIPPKYNGGIGAVNRYGVAVAGVRKEGITKEYIINTKGEVLSEGEHYFDLEPFGDKLIYNTYGTFLSPKTGKPIVDFPYTSVYPLDGDRKDLASARRDDKVGLIDTSLTELLPPEYEHIGAYSNDRMKIKKDNHWGYADEQFRIRIPMIYDDAYYFQYPMLTKVTKNKKDGVIDRFGREVIPLNYTQISFDYACDRIYADKGDEGVDIYDREGRLLLTSDFSYIGLYGRKNYVAYRQNDKLGFMDYDFKVLYEPEFDGAGDFYDGLAWVRKDKKGGYINEQFQLVIPVQFDDFQPFIAGFAKVKKDSREYYINTKGEEFTPTEAQLKDRELEMKRRGWN